MKNLKYKRLGRAAFACSIPLAMNKLVVAITTFAALLLATPAIAVTYNFSFTSNYYPNDLPGPVTGRIIVPSADYAGGPATVYIDSYPDGLGNICAVPCLVTSPPWAPGTNGFTLSGGVFTGYVLHVGLYIPTHSGFEWEFLLTTNESMLRWYECPNAPENNGGICQVYAYQGISLSSATPLPAGLPLFITGLGALGLAGWRRKRKAASSAAA